MPTPTGFGKSIMDAIAPVRNLLKDAGIETIRKILNNEKYYGNVLLQKTYITDFFTGRQVPNKGEYARYLITEHHEAIINTKGH